ncbi:MAG: efflux RND transporter periplasmic adaptor subunit, partial [Actinomycetota bacterium]|nr:efflux RND transporter periplasmic adaptor subunit [Actinomycetota bacterium]
MKIPRRVLINGGLALVIVAALVIAGIVVFKPFSATTASATGTQLTGTVQQGTVSSTISASGAVAEAKDTPVSFAVSGTVASVDVAVGQTVTAGQQLGTIDPTALQAAVNLDYTAYVYAGQDLTAAEAQPNAQVSSINQAKQALTQARTTYNTAKANLAAATLTSPVAGLVIAVNGVVGNSTGSSSGSGSTSGSGTGASTSSTSGSSTSSSSSSAFVTIADVSSYIVTANIAEADIANVTVGQPAAISFPALTGVTATAKVTSISPTATSSNSVVTYATTITLDAIPAKVRLGQTATVAITVASSAADALYVPAAAITTASDGTSTVKVVDAKTGKTTAVDVTTGVIGDAGTEIKTGLTVGETIVLGTVSA